MQIRQANTLERETRSSLVDIFNAHHAGPLAIGDQQFDDLIQKFFLSKSKNEIFEKIVKPMIQRNLYEAEGKSAGSAELFLRLCTLYFDHKGRINLSNIDWDSVNLHLLKMSKIKPTKREIFSLIDKKSSSDVAELLKTALIMSSREDVIEVTRSHDVQTKITTEIGCSFPDIKIEPCYFSSKIWEKKQANVILVDGIIEKSIHVEYVLQKSNTDKEPYIIVCREATEEVKNACRTNFLRQTTDVVLCTAPYSEKTAHIFDDLKTIVGNQVISPELGDIITSHIYKKAIKVKKASIARGILLIENDKHDEIRNHREKLIEKISQINDEDVSDLIRKRLKTMTGRKILIKVGDDIILKQRNAVEQIDKTIRSIRDCITNGIILDTSNLFFLNQEDVYRPTQSVKTAISVYKSFIDVLERTGLILVEE
jgi:hypothetical protein